MSETNCKQTVHSAFGVLQNTPATSGLCLPLVSIPQTGLGIFLLPPGQLDNIVLYFTLTVPPSTQVYEWVLANLMLGG